MKIRHAMTVRHPVPSFWVILTSRDEIRVLQYVVVCCSVLQCVAMINVLSSWTMGNPYETIRRAILLVLDRSRWNVCVCVCVCAYVCVCVHACVCLCVCVFGIVFVCMCLCECVREFMYVHVYAGVLLCVCRFICVCVCVCECVRLNVYVGEFMYVSQSHASFPICLHMPCLTLPMPSCPWSAAA